MNSTQVLALVGMSCEARIARGPGVLVVCRQEGLSLASAFRSAVDHGFGAAVSFGIAGGLDPELRPGDCIVASSIVDAESCHRPDLGLSRRLLDLLPDADFAPIAGVDFPVTDPDMKRALFQDQRVAAVDMESHLVARFAQAHGLQFAALRVVIDPAERAIPPSALLGLRKNGASDLRPVLWSLMSRPRDAAGMALLAWDFCIALAALRSTRGRLGRGFGIMGWR